MGIKDAFFRILQGNNIDNDVKKSAEIAEDAVVKSEQPEIEKVEEVIRPVDKTIGISVITGEPTKELEEEPAVKEDEATDSSAIEESLTVETPVNEDVVENTTEQPEIEQPIETVTEELNTVAEAADTAEDIIEPAVDESENNSVEHNTVIDCCEENKEVEYDAIAIDDEKLTKLENAIVLGIHSIFSEVREILEKEDK